MKACDNCGKGGDILVPVLVYDEDSMEDEQDWCPECVADATAEEFTDLDPREVAGK